MGSAGHAAVWVFLGMFWLALIAVIVWLIMQLVNDRQARTVAQGSAVQPNGAPPVQHIAPGASAPTMGASPGPVAAVAVESPFDILDRRFALGEIDVETYRAQRAALAEARGGER